MLTPLIEKDTVRPPSPCDASHRPRSPNALVITPTRARSSACSATTPSRCCRRRPPATTSRSESSCSRTPSYRTPLGACWCTSSTRLGPTLVCLPPALRASVNAFTWFVLVCHLALRLCVRFNLCGCGCPDMFVCNAHWAQVERLGLETEKERASGGDTLRPGPIVVHCRYDFRVSHMCIFCC